MNLPAQPKSVSREALLERERRWTVFAGAAAIVGVAIILISLGESAASVRTGDGLADRLVEISDNSTGLVLASIAQGVGWLLLGIPLVFMFRAAAGRSDRMRRGLIGVVVAAPIFLAIGSILSTVAVINAADEFADNSPAKIEACVQKELDRKPAGGQSDEARGDRDRQGGKSDAGQSPEAVKKAEQDCRSEVARDTRLSSSVSGLETGFGLAGVIAFTIGMAYVALWGLRTGLLGRFWGSLGIALGAVFVLFTIFSLVWFIYLGLLLIGWVPGGRPPAWASGEAMPWQKGPGRGDGPKDGGVLPPSDPEAIDGSGQPVEAPEAASAPELPEPPGSEPRKRKRRDTD